LVTLVALTSIAVMVATFPTPGAIKREVAIQVLITIVVMTPITCFGLYAARAGIIMLQAQSDRLTSLRDRLIRRKVNGASTMNDDTEIDMLDPDDDGPMLAMSPSSNKLKEYLLHDNKDSTS
jgi:hypothetical protein